MYAAIFKEKYGQDIGGGENNDGSDEDQEVRKVASISDLGVRDF
jgi:hypothetical protein